jgi:hypothetical protein
VLFIILAVAHFCDFRVMNIHGMLLVVVVCMTAAPHREWVRAMLLSRCTCGRHEPKVPMTITATSTSAPVLPVVVSVLRLKMYCV